MAELSGPLAAMGSDGRNLAIVVNLLTVVAMFSRNLVLLAIFSPRAGVLAAAPFALMVLGTAGFIWWSRRRTAIIPDLKLGSPVSIRQVGTFGLIFLIEILYWLL